MFHLPAQSSGVYHLPHCYLCHQQGKICYQGHPGTTAKITHYLLGIFLWGFSFKAYNNEFINLYKGPAILFMNGGGAR